MYAEWDSADDDRRRRARALPPTATSSASRPTPISPQRLRAERPDIVFNIAEGLHGANREAHVPAICEFFGIPYSGSDPFTLSLCLDKARTKEILRRYGIPTAPFALVESAGARQPRRSTPRPLPLALSRSSLKPVHEGSSKGITERNFVRSTATSSRRSVAELLETYEQPVLARDVPARRRVHLRRARERRDARVLPLVGMNFASLPDGALPIYGFEAKWIWDVPSNPLEIFECPARIDSRLRRAIEDVVLRAYRVLGCRDWSRIDVRLDADGVPNIVEVNPLPGILPEPGRQLLSARRPRAPRARLRPADSGRAAPRRRAARRHAGAAPTLMSASRLPAGEAMKVAILFDGASAFATTPDMLILGTVEAIETVAGRRGQRGRTHPGASGREVDREAAPRRSSTSPSTCARASTASRRSSRPVIARPRAVRLPFTGASSYTTAVCLRKHVVNATAREGRACRCRGSPWCGAAIRSRASAFRPSCKPAAEDASLGVEQRSVVRNTRAARRRASKRCSRAVDEVLVQRYVDGREVNVGILGDTVLPIAEIDFGRMPGGPVAHRHLSIQVGDGQRRRPRRACRAVPADCRPSWRTRFAASRCAAWKLVGGFGYGRVDMRIDANGRPWILEVNANPDIAPDAGLARMARVAGIEYPALIRNICELGLARATREQLSPTEWALAQQLSGVPAPAARSSSCSRAGSGDRR